MADVSISYKGNEIASMSATGVKTLLTGSTFCEGDISISYTKPSSGTDTSDATLNNGNQMLSGVTAYSQGTKYTGTIQSQAAQTITPTTTNQTIASGKYLSGAQTIEGIVCTNLTAENIADGVTVKIGTATDDDSVALVTGTHQGGGSSVTTVSFGDDAIFAGTYIGYVDGNGTYQTTTQLAMVSATTYQMLSKSILVWADTIDPMISGSISGSFSGLTLVGTKKFTGNRWEVDIYIFQVD